MGTTEFPVEEFPGSTGLTPEQQLLRQIFGESSQVKRGRTMRATGRLTVNVAGNPTVGEAIELLTDLRTAYLSIGDFIAREPRQGILILPMEGILSESWTSATDLVIGRIEMNSPGIWEFLGQLNPLKIVADFIQQRHERKKDNEYRNRAEEERLMLENALLRNKVINERIGILTAAGVSKQEIRRQLLSEVVTPLNKVGIHVDTKLIDGAKVDTPEDEAA